MVLADLLHGGPRAGPVAGSLARRKRWPARIFHPRSRTPSAPKWRNDAIPHERGSRRAPESYALATFPAPSTHPAAPARTGAVLDVPAAGRRRRTRERPAALIPDAAAIVTPPARPGSDTAVREIVT